jgi:DNA helicase HerA-like ATPase
MQLVAEFLETFVNNDLVLTDEMKPDFYTLKDLYDALEFALISEGALKSDNVFDLNNILKVRLDGIINGTYGKYFEVDKKMTRAEYIKELYLSADREQVQIVNFNLNYVDERFAKTLTKIYSKLFLDYAVTLENNKDFSVEIMLEEAHRYVTVDSDTEILGYNIFDRITKEGRKYGVILGLITQRPSELSTTALSQCSNYIVLRMFHPDDLNIIKSITHSVSEHDIDKLKTLTSGTAMCFGTAFKMPVYAKIDKPNPTPTSNNVSVTNQWFVKVTGTNSNAPQVAKSMQQTIDDKKTIETFQ